MADVEVTLPTVDESIDKAITDSEKPEDKKVAAPESKASDKKEDVEEEVEVKEDLSDAEIAEAKNIIRALKDPVQGRNLIEYLAKQTGLIQEKEGLTKKE